jgi:hypothetical protein
MAFFPRLKQSIVSYECLNDFMQNEHINISSAIFPFDWCLLCVFSSEYSFNEIYNKKQREKNRKINS